MLPTKLADSNNNIIMCVYNTHEKIEIGRGQVAYILCDSSVNHCEPSANQE
jgi:hypothetical protein